MPNFNTRHLKKGILNLIQLTYRRIWLQLSETKCILVIMKSKQNNAAIDFVSIIDSDVQEHSINLYKNRVTKIYRMFYEWKKKGILREEEKVYMFTNFRR